MNESINILAPLISDREELISKLQEAEYAFAAWKLPNTSDIRLVISLSSAKRSEVPLSKMDKGFVLNLFEDNHPIKPYHIPADIILENDELVVDPRIQDKQLEALITDLHTEPSRVKKSQMPTEFDPSSNQFEETVTCAVQEIKKGTFEKVVVSRYKDQELPEGFSAWAFFSKISKSYPNAFCSLSFVPGKGLWIGASPELLIHDSSSAFKTIALAGTKKLKTNQKLTEIAWTQKEIEEQAFVSRYIINCFKKIRLREFHEHGPKTAQAGNLAHLKTEFEVKYDETSFEGLAEQMLELLHPTSAVCGMPIEQTKPWIKQHEQYNRSFYSGFLGPINFESSTDLFVNLRCLRLSDGKLRFYAGAGITEDSVPAKEYEETEMKMNVLQRLI